MKVKKKSTKHTVKFKDLSDREEVLVVTVEPPSPSTGSPEPPSAATRVTFALPSLTGQQRAPTPSATGEGRVPARPKDTPKPKASRAAGEQRLAEGCTSLMYACQQGLTGDILKELRQKVSFTVSSSLSFAFFSRPSSPKAHTPSHPSEASNSRSLAFPFAFGFIFLP